MSKSVVWLNSALAVVGVVWSISQVWRDGWGLASRAGDAWQTGDWLINYAGGFVRRGLAGEIVQRFSTDQPGTLWLVFWLQMTALAVLGIGGLVLFFRTDRSPGWLALLLSPAFMLFPGLNVVGGARKEILILAVVALLALIVRLQLRTWWLAIPFALYPVAVFSHEVGALAAPVMLYLVWSFYSTRKKASWHRFAGLTYVSFVAVAGLVVAALAPGNAQQASEICDSWVQIGVRDALCGGPIDYLKTTTSEAFDFVRSLYPGIWLYLGLAALALLPLLALGVTRRFWLLVGMTYLCLIPLFALGIDYGRWIYIATSLTSLAILATWEHETLRPWNVPEVGALAYVLLWTVPYTYGAPSMPLFNVLVAYFYQS
jgi:hypothetical protein